MEADGGVLVEGIASVDADVAKGLVDRGSWHMQRRGRPGRQDRLSPFVSLHNTVPASMPTIPDP